MSFKNKASQRGFNEWWSKDYIQQFVKEYRDNERVIWLLKLAFEGGLHLALNTLQKGISSLTESTTENLE